MWLWRERVGPLGRRLLNLLTDSANPFFVVGLRTNRGAIASMLEKAQGNVNIFTEECNKALDSTVNECGKVVAKLVYSPIISEATREMFGEHVCWGLIKLAKGSNICVSMSDTYKKALEGAKKGLLEALGSGNDSQSFSDVLAAKLPDAGEWERQAAWNDFASFQEDLLGDLSSLAALLRSAVVLLELATVIFFFWGLMSAASYHRRYLSSLPFDNFYIDRYFRHIDRRRKARGGTVLLPLRGVDRDDLVPIFSLLLSRREREEAASSTALLFSIPALFLFLLLGLLLYGATAIFTDYLNALAVELDFVYRVKLVNRFEPSFENIFGDQNTITMALNRLVSGLRWPKEHAYWGKCLKFVMI